ncbi:hypothetical protein LV779_02870 [Streptomyces thinghirensis]|nr:hypothetical protein [Streptomyces thinghirensis]
MSSTTASSSSTERRGRPEHWRGRMAEDQEYDEIPAVVRIPKGRAPRRLAEERRLEAWIHSPRRVTKGGARRDPPEGRKGVKSRRQARDRLRHRVRGGSASSAHPRPTGRG